MGAGVTVLQGFEGWDEGSWEPLSSFSGAGMNLNHWSDGIWAEGSWVQASWGDVEEPAEPVAARRPTPGVSWRNRLPQERWAEPEEDTAPQVVAQDPQQREERTASVDSVLAAPAVAVSLENVQRAAREAYLQEHARLMALEAARKAKRKRDAETLLLLM